MSVEYRFDSNIVVMEMAGEYSLDDIRIAIVNSLADPACPANSFLLINLTNSQSILTRSSEDVKTMAHFVASLGERFHNRIALVAPGDLPFGQMRMSSVGAEERGIQAEVFRSFIKARAWLLSRDPPTA